MPSAGERLIGVKQTLQMSLSWMLNHLLVSTDVVGGDTSHVKKDLLQGGGCGNVCDGRAACPVSSLMTAGIGPADS